MQEHMSRIFSLSQRPLPGLLRDSSGVAMIEFAMALPLLTGITLYGIEAANIAYSAQIVADIAVHTADSTARVRTAISEQDVTDILYGVKSMGTRMDFASNGRIIISGLEPVIDSGTNAVVNQKITWQRCSGALRQDSSYGLAGAQVGVDGMGPTGKKIKATASSYAIVVEVRYNYQPIISEHLYGPRELSATSAMMVRERESNAIGTTGTASACGTYSA